MDTNNNKMKVLHILNELKYSGAEIMYTDAAPVFRSLGCELFVVNVAEKLGEFSDNFREAGYIVYHWPYPSSYIKKWKYYIKVIAFLKANKIDVVHIHTSALKWGMSYCAWRAGCRSVYTFHNVFRSHWYSYIYHLLLRYSAKYFFHCKFQTISDSVYNNEKDYYHNKTIKIYNWYGSNRFYPAKEGEKESIRRELNISLDTLVIISVGGCSEIKRHTDIIKAIPEVIEKYPNLLYLHLGEGDATLDEQQFAEHLHVRENIRFCGNQRNVRRYLIASDIYLMPSKFEGIPITAIEAMASKVPSILYDVPGLKDFNRERKCALIIPEDYHILGKKILELYSDKNLQKELAENAKAFVDKEFYMEVNAEKIFQLYL